MRMKGILKAVLFRFAAIVFDLLIAATCRLSSAPVNVFAKFLTNTEEARASVDYYAHQ